MKKMIKNFISLVRKEQDQGGEYQMSTVLLEKPIPAIKDLSKVNVNVSGNAYHTLGQ